MPLSVLNWALAKAVLERDRPNADPAAIDRYSVLAALVPGTAGLLVPFIVESNLPNTSNSGSSTGGSTGSSSGTPQIPPSGSMRHTPQEVINTIQQDFEERVQRAEQSMHDRMANLEASQASLLAELKAGLASITKPPARGTP